MNILPHMAYRVRRGPFVCFFALIILFFTNMPGKAQEAPGSRKIQVEAGKIKHDSFTIRNNCLKATHWRVKNKVKNLRFDESTKSVLIPPQSTKTMGITVNATKLKSRVYQGYVEVGCLDCQGTCATKRSRVPFEITVVQAQAQTQTSAQLAIQYHKILADKLAKSQAAVTPDAQEMLDKILERGAEVAIETGDSEKIKESLKNVEKLARALVEYGEKPGERPPGTSFAARSRWNAPVVITPESIRRALAALCPLFPFCK